ncbi:MAG: Sec-independent protein translocase protein TatB [Acidimicrobiaceae bacterium]|nr:Sec-independent protein translocase protein TatB [Acidimicrobiaceae bacterium]
MGNLGGGEILVILLVALIVLGPTKLPPAVRQVGKVVGEIRRVGQGFQQELREAAKPLQEATADFKAADKSLRETTQKPLKEMTDTLKAADPRKVIEPPPDTKGKGGDVAKGKDASGKGSDTSGSVPPGTDSWGTAAASVTPPPAPAGEETDAPAGGEGTDAAAGAQSAAGSGAAAAPDAAAPDVAAPDVAGSDAAGPDPESRADDTA